MISCQQSPLPEEQEKIGLEIENQVAINKKELIVLVKITGKTELQMVIDENWAERIESTYNILKDSDGHIIYAFESPFSESGDWDLEIEHYFDTHGRLIAFEKRLAYFNSICTQGMAVEKQIDLYDNNYSVIRTIKTLTDADGNLLSEKDCVNNYDRNIDRYATVAEYVSAKHIEL